MAKFDLEARLAEARERGLVALDEPTGKAILESFGIRVPPSCVIGDDEDVRHAVTGLMPPFALKVIASGVVHKSDVGGVRLGIAGPEELAAAIGAMRQELRARKIEPHAWLVEQMAPRGVEVVVGGLIDPEFGPMVMVGLGGIFVEVLKDVAFRICPITLRDAHEMIEELRGVALLRGARGGDVVSVAAVAETLLGLGGEGGLLMQCEQHFTEIDINPLIVSRDDAVAADARFILRNKAWTTPAR